MNTINIVMQGKGGIGKSYVAWLLSQYNKEKDPDIIVIDTDPLTPSLQGFKSLEPKHIQIADQSEVHLEKFDELIELASQTESDVIIDTGSSTFLPISKYIIDDNVLEELHSMGKQVKIHVVINAKTDNELLTTISCFSEIAKLFPEYASIVVWMNEFGGEIKTMDGLRFEDTRAYQEHKSRIEAMITLPNPPDLTLRDINIVKNSHLTIQEALNSPDFRLMAKSRLKRSRDVVYKQLDAFYAR